ncbi:armadillo-type protein, partial [Phakopsora pachyrhizi]
SIGVIGSSRPGSRVAGNHCEHGSLSLQSIQGKETSQLPKPDAQSTPLQDSGKRQFKPINMSPNFSSVPACQDGYTLGSSMWATPNSSASQFPFSQGIPNYLNLNSENKTSSPTSQIIKSGVQPSPEFLLGKQAQNSEFNSPALSFTQTGSAPSTGRSFFAPEGNGPPSKSFMTGFQAGSIDDAAKNAFASQAQAIEGSNLNNLNGPVDDNSIDSGWPPTLSFEEEAFYSKSNVTKVKSGNPPTIPPSLGAQSSDVWKISHVSHPPGDPSQAEVNHAAALNSSFLPQPYASDIISQLALRIEQLERKSIKQESEISQLRANVSLISAQSQKNHQSASSAAGSALNGNLPSASSRVRTAQPSALGSVAQAGSGFNAPSNTGSNVMSSTSQTAQSTNVTAGHSRDSSLPSHPGSIPVPTPTGNFAQRNLGSIDCSTGQKNSLPPVLPVVHQNSPTLSLLNNGPGMVNYRALLAGETECDYEHFIRRITEHNDQQASIFMQQKLKQSAMSAGFGVRIDKAEGQLGSESSREDITRLVIRYGIELMTNRFGNFLVSRAVEHATSQERLTLAEKIKGNIVMLAQDTFATHCLQKMIDMDEEDENRVRWLISHELLKKKDTVTHKSAGHVWARLLSIGGGSSASMSLRTGGEQASGPNQYGGALNTTGTLEQSLNDILRGEWAKTAKDEVGSLIVQSVLENWNESAKSDVIGELLADIYSCSVQQWGNFVILHLIEHSTGLTQKKIFDRLMETQLACDLSLDNFGAKAIEKVLKVSGTESKIVEDYVKAICEYGHGRPALIDIACHQAGAQVLTLLFTSAPNSIRELMIQTVRRNGVTMKSSKAGSKIWFLVERTRAWVGH